MDKALTDYIKHLEIARDEAQRIAEYGTKIPILRHISKRWLEKYGLGVMIKPEEIE